MATPTQSGSPVVPPWLDSPWLTPSTALVIDPYDQNPVDFGLLRKEPRVAAIIHRATIGTNGVDTEYSSRQALAALDGYLWGSYHFGLPVDPVGQANHYIDTVQPGANDLIALDLEDVTIKTRMDIPGAERFVEQVKLRTGRYPVLYSNKNCTEEIAANAPGSVLTTLPLWYARFLPRVTDFPQAIWGKYVLWQFSSNVLVQIALPGVQSDMDVSVYDGTTAELSAAWPFT